jgi:hypothetical protein
MLEEFDLELPRLRVKTARGAIKHARKHWRKDLLLSVLNVDSNNCEPFWRSKLAPPREADTELLCLRDELRELLSRDVRDVYIPQTLNRWLRWRPAGSEPVSPFVLNWPTLDENPGNLRVSLVRAVTELFWKVGRCENPECRTYFIKVKKKYRFCDTPKCQEYAQRKYKSEWWAANGRAWRTSRKKKGEKVHKKVNKTGR